MVGLIFTYIVTLVLIVLGIIVLKWFFKNKPDGEVSIANLLTTPQILLSSKGRMSVIAAGLILLISGGLMLKSALGL